MTIFARSVSLSSKLTRMNLLVSGTALLLAFVAFFSYDLISYQQTLIRSLGAEARISGLNSVSALLFNDRESARATLSALASSSDVMNAALVTESGEVFAEYRRPGAAGTRFPAMAPAQMQQDWASGRHVLLARRIVFQGKREGIVYISAQLQELGQRARQYLLIALGILAFCMFAAMLVTRNVRRTIASPIVSLAEMSRAVSRDRDYSLRAPPIRDGDEIAVLIGSFNEMLTQIEQRDFALRHARDGLEQRVQERTAELKAANRELEAFSYTVAHDLRGPLDAIGGIGFVLQQGYADSFDAEGQEMLARLRQSSVKMATLIDDLLNLSRAGTTSLERSNIDLSALAADVARDLKAAEPERDVQFVIAPGAIVLADAGLMRIVLENLIRNAWKYSSRHSSARIEFGYQRVGARLAYFVRDNGAGFNPAFADRLFKPFQRLHTQGDFAGTGIGLATVERIVTRHGGTAWAEGAPEKGATFYFSLED